MPVRVGVLGVAHVHAPSYAHSLQNSKGAVALGHWDKDPEAARRFEEQHAGKAWEDREALLAQCDAVVIAGENLDHADLIESAAAAGKAVLCEKPLAASKEQADRIRAAVEKSGTMLMTAFPCPFSPAFESAQAKVESGEVGRVLAVCATNHGKCPGGWFTDPAKSGGGAMIDHVVHVADVLRRLLREEPVRVHAVTGNNMHGESWEDTAMLTIEYPGGAFATLDASWSRPESYKAWGDVTLKIVGEKGVIELDLFPQAVDWFSEKSGAHSQLGFGTGLDQRMVDEFIEAVRERRTPRVTMEDGLAASEIALAGYESARTGQPVSVGRRRVASS